MKCSRGSKAAIGGFERHIWSYGISSEMSWIHQILTKNDQKVFFFDLDRNISESHMTIKRLTKFDFSHVSSIFNPFWSVYVDMENPCKSGIWVQKSVFSTIFGFPLEYSTDVEISTWKLFFWKVHIIGYIFHIYHMCSKWILMELRAFEVTCKIIVFCQNHLWKYYLRVYGKDSKVTYTFSWISTLFRVFLHLLTF